MGKGEAAACGSIGFGGILGRSWIFVAQLPAYQEILSPVDSLDQAAWEYIIQPWAGDLEKLSPAAQDGLLEAIPKTHNTIFADNRNLSGRCADYCSLLAHSLLEKNIEVGMIGGLYFDEIYPGTTIHDLEQQVLSGDETEEIFDWGSHTWLEIEGQLIDPTAGQFFKELPPDSWSSDFYLPSQVKMHGFLSGWKTGGLPLGNKVIYDSSGCRKKA